MDWSGALPTSTSRFVGATIRAAAETEAIEGGAIAVVIIIALLAVATVFWAETKGAANETEKVCPTSVFAHVSLVWVQLVRLKCTRSPRSAPTPVQQADFEEDAFSFTMSTSHQQPVQ